MENEKKSYDLNFIINIKDEEFISGKIHGMNNSSGYPELNIKKQKLKNDEENKQKYLCDIYNVDKDIAGKIIKFLNENKIKVNVK